VDLPADRLVAGRYRLLTTLGSGGMGTVWRARDEVLDREVAVKEVTFPQGLAEADRAVLVERTRREARAAARLDHASAVTVYDVVEQDGAPYLVMELVEARTLADVVREDGPLTPQRTAEVGLSLLGALEAAHARGIVHRDVKPSNVMVRDDGRVVLTDFGIATSTGDSSLTSTGLLLGSPAYIAPERARGRPPEPASDLWSLGATLFTAVEGRPPYSGDEPILTVTAVVTGEHEPFVAAGPLEPVLEGLLEKDPALRLDAAQAGDLLRRVAGSRPDPTRTLPVPTPVPQARTSALDLGDVRDELAAAPTAPAPVPPPTRPVTRAVPPPSRPAPPAARRRPGWLAPLAVAGVLLAGGGAAWALSQDGDPGGSDTADPSAASTSSPSSAASTTPPPVVEQPSSPGPTSDPTPEATSGPTTEPTEDGPTVDGPAEDEPAGTTDSADGWTVTLPAGYERTSRGRYRQADTGRELRIETGEGQPDAVADRERQAASFARNNPSYQEIRIDPVQYKGVPGADWEFTFEGLHVLNRVFVIGGTGHSLWLQTPEDDVSAARQDFDRIADAFSPVGG
jgi:serine/threonine protein kinase